MTDERARPRRRPAADRPVRRPRSRPREDPVDEPTDDADVDGDTLDDDVPEEEPDEEEPDEDEPDEVEPDGDGQADEPADDDGGAGEPVARRADRRRPDRTRRTARSDRGGDVEPGRNGFAGRGRAATNGSLRPVAAARRAAEQLVELTGREFESVVSVERDADEGGWRIGVEVVETRRIPDSADILAVYEVQVDGSGDVGSFRRVGRYSRGRLHGRGER